VSDFKRMQISFAFSLSYCVKAFLADGLEGAILVYPMQKLSFRRGTHDKLRHVDCVRLEPSAGK